jgi:hypothetical protein
LDDETNEINALFIGKRKHGNYKDAPKFENGREPFRSCITRHNIMALATGGNYSAQVEIMGGVAVEERLILVHVMAGPMAPKCKMLILWLFSSFSLLFSIGASIRLKT